jgi:hypothetical protein
MQDVVEIDPAWNYEFFQSYYIKPQRTGLFPNRTFITRDGQVNFATNDWGLKGAPIDTAREHAVFWGDSVVFCVAKSWAERLNDAQDIYQFLNGGIEGDEPSNILHRMLHMNSQHKIKLNIFSPGWHAVGLYQDRVKRGKLNEADDVEKMLSTIAAAKFVPGFVLCTMPTFLSAEDWAEDFSKLFNSSSDLEETFTFWGAFPYVPENVKFVRDFILDRNDMVRRVAAKYQLPLIDWYTIFKFETMAQAKTCFFDVCHPRPSQYPYITKLCMPH